MQKCDYPIQRVLTFLFISFSRLPISHYSYFVTGPHHIQNSSYAAHISIFPSCSSVSPPAIPVCYLFSSCAVDSSSARRPSKETRSAPNQIHGLQITFIKQICVEASNLYTCPRTAWEGDQGRWVPGNLVEVCLLYCVKQSGERGLPVRLRARTFSCK